MAEKGMAGVEDYEWYVDLRRYGTVPHAGVGLGFERAVMYITGMANIRDILTFPRVPRWACVASLQQASPRYFTTPSAASPDPPASGMPVPALH